MESHYFNDSKSHLIVLDDLFTRAGTSMSVVTLFTFLARRLNITVIVLTQNIFAPAKHSLTLKRNTQYFIIFHTQFSSIMKNMSSELYGSKILIDAMKQLCQIETDPHHRYLLLDLHPKSALPESMVSNKTT